MEKEVRTVCYDEELRMEAYHFQGFRQPFPNHFHEYYVIGFVERGKRILFCRDREYGIGKDSIVLFHPGDSHGCVQSDEGAFDYRGFHIDKEVMQELTEEVTGRRELPAFSQNVICDGELLCYLRALHRLVMGGSREFEKEETLILLFSLLTERYGGPVGSRGPQRRDEIEDACAFLREHYQERICLDQICECAHLSRSTLLRAFTKAKGVTPYRYLETVRINEAKKLLEQGAAPVEAAMQTGFSDQSHFTNFFSMFIGVPPGIYRGIFLRKGSDTAEEERYDRGK